MNAAWIERIFRFAASRYGWISVALFSIPVLGASEQVAAPSRAWDFDLKAPGTYSVQIEHDLNGISAGSATATYTITVGDEIQSHAHELIVDRPFVPLRMDILSPRHMHVVITGISTLALQHTRVRILGGTSAAAGPSAAHFVARTTSADLKEVRAIRAILRQPDDQIDLGKAKVVIDKLIDPTIDAEGTLQALGFMVSRIRLMPEFGDTGDSKVRALKRYLYESGASNDNQTFQYDLTDPLAHEIRNKLLSSYITTKKGNCVTMPLLFVILGQRLGIDVTLTNAPKHLLVKFNSTEYGRWINLEATSGANPARDVWIRQQFPTITDDSISNGVYLQPLSKKETVAEMTEALADYHFKRQEYDKAIAVSRVALEYYPKDVGAMTLSGVAYLRLLHQHFLDKYPSPDVIPNNERGYYQYLAQNNEEWFSKAQALGWREPTKEEDDEYLQDVDRARQRKAQMNMN